MIIDFKYHTASLVAVFLALAIGILIGSTMNGSDLIASQQKEIIDRLENDFVKLRQENINLHTKIEGINSSLTIDKQFEEFTLPIVLNQRLAGQNIIIVESNRSYIDEKWHKNLVENLKEAGANIHSIIALPQDLGLKDKSKEERIITQLGMTLKQNKELFSVLAKGLAQEIGEQQHHRQALSVLESLGVARFFPGHPGPVSSIILIGGGNSSKEGRLDRQMILQWKKMGLRVIGVEPYATKSSFMEQYQKLGISTVDSIDRIPSQVTLVWLLQQGKEGNYGIKPTAEQMFPDVITY